MNGDEISRKWIQPAEEKEILIGVELVDTSFKKMVVFSQQPCVSDGYGFVQKWGYQI